MEDQDQLSLSWNDQLTDKEVYYLGKIVAHWGAIEYEVFFQTLQTYEDSVDDPSQLPAAMKNINFSSVLDLWANRVVNETPSDRGQVLRKQLEEIKVAKEFRNTLIHSMLNWTPQNIGQISAFRVRKREFIKIDISADDLVDFYLRLSRINFNLRSPGGVEELAQNLMDSGGGFSRHGLAMFSGHEILSDWQSSPLSADVSEDE